MIFINKKIVMIVVVIEVLAVFAGIRDFMNGQDFSTKLNRPAAGEDAVTENLTVTTGDESREVELSISPAKRSQKEAEKLIAKAKKEIKAGFAGENPSLDEVVYDLKPKTSYQEGAVTANWEFDNYRVIDASGHLTLDNITEETAVRADVTLTCDEVEEVYSFNFILKPPDTSTDRGFLYLLDKRLEEADKSPGNKNVMVLPSKVEDVKLSWSRDSVNTGVLLGAFGIVTGVALVFAGREDEKRKHNAELKQMERDYPDIISMLSLYVGAGISLKSAFLRIAKDYSSGVKKRGLERRAGFEGVCMLCRDMEDGKGELEAYGDFGKRMGQKDYRKLSILITQNLKKGSTQLLDQLEKEEHQAFETRKMRAKIAGEEASTKLLLPMFGLLAIVIVVLIFPAFTGIEI